MKARLTEKRLSKQIRKSQLKAQQQQRRGEQNQRVGTGQPQLNNLSDFVTSIRAIYTSRPLFTGGRIIATHNKLYSSCHGEICIYDLPQRKIISMIKQANEEIVNFSVCPNEKLLVFFTNSELLRVITLEQRKVVHLMKMPKMFPCDMAYSADAKYLAIGFANSLVKIYTVETMRETHSYRCHQMAIKKLEWHPDVNMLQLVSADEEKNIAIFDYILNKPIATAVDAGKSFVLTPSARQLITVCDQAVHVYEYKTLRLEYRIDVGVYIDCVLLCAKQDLVFGGYQTGLFTMKLSDKDHVVKAIENATDVGVVKLLSSQANKKFIVVSAQQNLFVLDSKSHKVLQTIVGYNDEIIDLKFSKGAASPSFILVSNSCNAKVINSTSHQLQCLLQGHTEIILCSEYYHPYVLTAGKDKTIKLWSLEGKKVDLLANYRGHSDDVSGVCLLLKNKLVVSVGEDKMIKIWAFYEQSNARVDIRSAINTVLAHDKCINTVRASPCEKYLATCSHDRTVKIWDLDLKLLFNLAGHRKGVWDIAFHEIELILVSAAGDGMIKGWSLLTGECLWSMGQGLGLVRCCWIYHHQVVTGSVDGIIKIWDIRKKTSLSYDKHEGKIWALDVRKTDQQKCQIISGASDSVYHIWEDSTEGTRETILQRLQSEEQQKLRIEQFLHQKSYIEAAKIAFSGNYTQMFANVMSRMFSGVEEDDVVTFDEEGTISLSEQRKGRRVSEEELGQFVAYLCDKDLDQLLLILLNMNSTIKHFKAANRLLFALLQQRKFRRILQCERTFKLPEGKQDSLSRDSLNSKESDLGIFLKQMHSYSSKHSARLDKYVRASYWLDHLQQATDPFLRK